jgi:hypothetical protein
MPINAHQAPIVFTLNNTDIHHTYTATAFVIVERLLGDRKSSIHKFISDLGYFTAADFFLLNTRIINVRNKRIPMNEKHIIIYFAVVHFACAAFLIDEEMSILNYNGTDDSTENLEEIREKVLSFGIVIGKKFRADFKDRKIFMAAVAKIASI